MSYLELPGGIADFSKAVVSFWARVPLSTLNNALGNENLYDPLYKIVPFMVFGSRTDSQWAGFGQSENTPSFIGICANNALEQWGLACHLQWDRHGSGGYADDNPSFEETGFNRGFSSSADASTANTHAVIPFAADRWHHILLSWDFSGVITTHATEDPVVPDYAEDHIDSAGLIWVALDDHNHYNEGLHEERLSIFGPLGGYREGNSFITSNGYSTIFFYNDGGYSFDPAPLHTAGSPFGLPAVSRLVDGVHAVELAELQFFTGVTLTTSVEANRRAFIDADGKPVPPVPPMVDNPDYDPGLPISAGNPKQIPDPDGSPAEKLLGQKPAILLHGDGNWIAGRNTGPPLIDNPDYDPSLPESSTNPIKVPDPAKQFTPTGKIVAYTPDPSLHGPQSPTPPPEPVSRERRMMAALAA